eukprot:CAMPEP_0182435656 /NCGR_PEP_ID=MMETSP1167-20130531/76949_1 /TAXON_ID=2988 /ORGANISM="Mallomonas Sp, Strain CCMP3275" /LENGTH=309 /DNA_ID=CAMNT_0024626935 /DNA_START=76 /DNA_END=1005 /DNA_ORIENTATION=-
MCESAPDPIIIDQYVPNECPKFAKPSDHLLIEINATQGTMNKAVGPAYAPPGQLFHILLEQSDALPLHKGIKGMCKNAIRLLKWDTIEDNVDLSPFLSSVALTSDYKESNVTVTIQLHHITDPLDYELIDAFKIKNISLVLDLIDEHKGVNAMDEYGQTALMIAVQKQELTVVAGLLNARMPKVNVNTAKSSGYTALFYAVDLKTTSIMKALLRRGADPNSQLLQEGAAGNTPLHFACLLEKLDHATLLLEFGADPLAVNQYNMTPLQLLPRSAVAAVKLQFKKLFEHATANKLSGTSQATSSARRGEF